MLPSGALKSRVKAKNHFNLLLVLAAAVRAHGNGEMSGRRTVAHMQAGQRLHGGHLAQADDLVRQDTGGGGGTITQHFGFLWQFFRRGSE